MEVVLQADAAFAKPEIYEALEQRDVKYAIRMPPNNSFRKGYREAVNAAGGKSELQAGGIELLMKR